jgi:uncharacterized protein (TIGR02001 family)
MRKSLVLALAFAAVPALAEEPSVPEYNLTANIGLVSNYYFRGMTQTWGGPAVQAGADLTHSSGLAVGTWLSNVSGNQFAGGSLEWDVYGSYTYKFNEDWSAFIGVYSYLYPGANVNNSQSSYGHLPSQNYNTVEGNFGINWRWVGAKISYSFTDYFGAAKDTGFRDSTAGTYYPELNVNYPVWGPITLVGHVGYTGFSSKLQAPNSNGQSNPSYTDWKVGANYTFDGWVFGAYYVGGSNTNFYKDTSSAANSSHRDLVVNSYLLSVNKTF